MKAVFLDRDGVINRNLEGTYVREISDFEFLPGSVEAVHLLAGAGFLPVVVSNQAGVGKGLMSPGQLDHLDRWMREGIGLQTPIKSYYCTHAPGDGCGCRKPEPGLLLRAAGEMGIDLGRSWLVGDNVTDILAGRRAGCKTVMVLTGLGKKQLPQLEKHGLDELFVVPCLLYAARLIICMERQGG